MNDLKFELGMLFTSGKVFRTVVRRYVIKNQKALRLKKNVSDKVKWVCSEGCEWKCYGLKQQTSNTSI